MTLANETFYFLQGSFLQTFKGLHQALSEREAFVKLIGSPQSGKSSLCQKLSAYLVREGFQVVLFGDEVDSPEMLRTLLARELGLPDSVNFARVLEESELGQSGKPLVLIFDEAQHLSDMTLVEIYRLSEVQGAEQRLLNILFCGSPDFDKQIQQKQEFNPLRQHLTHSYILPPMDSVIAGQFVKAYLEYKGMPELALDGDAEAYLLRVSQGLPGAVIAVCDLLVADRQETGRPATVSRDALIHKVSESGDVLPIASRSVRRDSRLVMMGPVAAVVVIASVGLMYRQLLDPGIPAPELTSAPEQPAPSPFLDETNLVPEPVVAEPQSKEATQAEANLPDIEPAPQQVSDSGLALVTAEERGIQVSELVDPIFESILNAQDSVGEPTVRRLEDDDGDDVILLGSTSNANRNEFAQPQAVIEPQQLSSAGQQAGVSTSEQQDAIVEIEPSAVAMESRQQEANPVEPVAQVAAPENDLPTDTELAAAADPGEVTDAIEVAGPDETAEAIAVAAAAETATVNDAIGSDERDVTETVILEEPGDADVAEINDAGPGLVNAAQSRLSDQIEVVPADPYSLEALEQVVDTWVSAWREQDLDAYFASYHGSFQPRYRDNVEAWRRYRQRVIGGAEWIRLQMRELRLVESSEDSVEVHFWLDYESPTYADQTLKKLVLARQDEAWLILEEINLEVRS